MIKKRFILSLLLITLVILMTLSNAVTAAMTSPGLGSSAPSGNADVNLVTGDMQFSVPLMKVSGVNGFDFPIVLTYSGGGGIRMVDEASWAGLGWDLGPGMVTRTVIGLPDDMQNRGIPNVYFHHKEQTDDKTPWYVKLEDSLITIGVVLMSIAAPYALASVMSATTAGAAAGATGLTALLKIGATVTGYASSAISTVSPIAFSQSVIKEETEKTWMSGYLYNPRYGETYSESNYPITDGGRPDMWIVTGAPYSGRMVIVDKNTNSKYISTIEDAKFVLKDNVPTIDAVKTYFKIDMNDCASNPYPNCELYTSNIDQFIVIVPDGKRYVYGDPSIPGSIVRVHTEGNYRRANYRVEKEGHISDVFIEEDTIILQHYPYAWKLVAILSPNYIDGSSPQDHNPLKKDASGNLIPDPNNFGEWIAFTYQTPSNSKYFNFGNVQDADISDNDKLENYVGDWRGVSGGYKDVSYPHKIITPVQEAEFVISKRLDGKEISPYYYHMGSGYYGPWSWDFENLGWKTNTPYYADAVDPKDFPSKLDKIILKDRISGETIFQVKFNDGASESEMYLLTPGTPGSTASSGGKYTLRKVKICDASNSCMNPMEFKYGKYKI